jgi:integrase
MTTGHVIKRGAYWRVFLEYGKQAAQRCPTCHKRFWSDDEGGRTCPAGHGELEEIVARRQEMLPDKYTTKAAASKALHDELREREHGDYVEPVDLTLKSFLEDRWLPALDIEELSPSTVESYRLHVKRIVPLIGSIPLQKLARNDISAMAGRLARETSPKTGRPLSPSTRGGLLVVLQSALGNAVKDGLLRVNPAVGVKRPKVRRPEMHTWSSAELATFLRATRGERLGPLWHLLALTGLRRGEALGLHWSDVDLEHGRLSIQRQRALTGYVVDERPTKTGKPRAVSLDAQTVAVLRRQSRQQLEDADEWGNAWVGNSHVFARENGEPWHPDRVRKLFEEAMANVEVPRIRMHDLRHTWATLALRAGVHPKVVQERLGHSNISITMDTYSHVLPDMQESAAELVASLVDLGDPDDE